MNAQDSNIRKEEQQLKTPTAIPEDDLTPEGQNTLDDNSLQEDSRNWLIRFLEWLFGLDDDQAKQLPESLQNFRNENKESYKGDDANRQQVVKNLDDKLKNNRDFLNGVSDYMQQLGVDPNLVADVEQLSQYYGNYGLTGYRGLNPFGGVRQDVQALRKRVQKYREDKQKLNKEVNASREKIIRIQETLLKVGEIDKILEKINEKDEQFKDLPYEQKQKAVKIAREQLEKQRDEIIRSAAHLRSVDRPLSLTRDIERELRNTLGREERVYQKLTGKSIEVSIEEGKFKAEEIDAFKKLNETIYAVDSLRNLRDNTLNFTSEYFSRIPDDIINGNETLRELRESFKNDGRISYLTDDQTEDINNAITKVLSDPHIKNMRAWNHRAGIPGFTNDLLLWELKQTAKKNSEGSEEQKLLQNAMKDVGELTGRLEKAQKTLQAAHQVNVEVQKKLGKIESGLGSISLAKFGQKSTKLPNISKQQTTMGKNPL